MFQEALGFLWKCIENTTLLSSSAVNTVLSALKDHVGSSEEKIKLAQLCLESIRTDKCQSQHFIVLKNILDSASTKSQFIGSNQFDKISDKLYQGMPNFAIDMVKEFTRRITSDVVEDHFIDEQIYGTRMRLIIMIIFRSKKRPDSEKAFEMVINFLTQEPSRREYLLKLLKILENEPVINKTNSKTFFDIFEKKDSLLKPEMIDHKLFKTFKRIFIDVNLEINSIQKFSANNYYSLVKKDRVVFLNSLWNMCLVRNIVEPAKELFSELLVNVYFMAERSFEAPRALAAWNEFLDDAKIQQGYYQNQADVIGNMAYLFNIAMKNCMGRVRVIDQGNGDLIIPVLIVRKS